MVEHLIGFEVPMKLLPNTAYSNCRRDHRRRDREENHTANIADSAGRMNTNRKSPQLRALFKKQSRRADRLALRGKPTVILFWVWRLRRDLSRTCEILQ